MLSPTKSESGTCFGAEFATVCLASLSFFLWSKELWTKKLLFVHSVRSRFCLLSTPKNILLGVRFLCDIRCSSLTDRQSTNCNDDDAMIVKIILDTWPLISVWCKWTILIWLVTTLLARCNNLCHYCLYYLKFTHSW